MISLAARVALKDLRIEVRSRVVLWQVLPFATIALLLAGLSIGPSEVAMRRAAPGLYYLVMVLVALFMIGRSRAIESGAGTRESIATLGLDPGGVFLGKAAALFLELVVVGAAVLGGVIVLLHEPAEAVGSDIFCLVASLAAIAAVGTIYGALTSSSSGPATLLPLLVLPALSPVLIAGERSLAAASHGGAQRPWVVLLIVSLVAYLSAGVVLYGAVEDLS